MIFSCQTWTRKYWHGSRLNLNLRYPFTIAVTAKLLKWEIRLNPGSGTVKLSSTAGLLREGRNNTLRNQASRSCFTRKSPAVLHIDFSVVRSPRVCRKVLVALPALAEAKRTNTYHPLTFYSCLNLFALDKVHTRFLRPARHSHVNYNDNKCSKVGQIFCARHQLFSVGGHPITSHKSLHPTVEGTYVWALRPPSSFIFASSAEDQDLSFRAERQSRSCSLSTSKGGSSGLPISSHSTSCFVESHPATRWWYSNINYGIKMKGCPS